MMLSHKVDFCIMHFQKALDEVCYDEFSEDPFLSCSAEFSVTGIAVRGKVVKGRRYKATEKDPLCYGGKQTETAPGGR